MGLGSGACESCDAPEEQLQLIHSVAVVAGLFGMNVSVNAISVDLRTICKS